MKYNRGTVTARLAVAVLTALAGRSISAQKAAEPAQRTRPAAEVFAQLGQSAGVVVLADSTVAGRLPLAGASATPETVEARIAELVRALPLGTVWVKLYLPTPVGGRWNGDVVADYVRAQARLLGTTVGRPTPAGTVELLGRQLPADRASEHINALNLKLVYLITHPQAPAVAVTAAGFRQMTAEQREAYARQQSQRLLALDPASRLAALLQMMRSPSPEQFVMRMVIEQMPVEEQVQLKTTVAEDDRREAELKGAAGK